MANPESDTSPQAKAKRDKLTIGLAVAGLIVGYLTLRRASGAPAAPTAQGSSYSYPMIGSGTTGAEMVGYDNGSSTIGLSDTLAQIQQQLSALGPAASTASPISGTGSVPTSASVAATNSKDISGYIHVNTPGAGSAYAAAGDTVYVLPAGMTPQAGALVPWVQNGKIINPKVPTGSGQYIKA